MIIWQTGSNIATVTKSRCAELPEPTELGKQLQGVIVRASGNIHSSSTSTSRLYVTSLNTFALAERCFNPVDTHPVGCETVRAQLLPGYFGFEVIPVHFQRCMYGLCPQATVSHT